MDQHPENGMAGGSGEVVSREPSQPVAVVSRRRTGRPWKWAEYVTVPVGCCSFLPYPRELSPKERRDFHQSMRFRIADAARRLGARIRSHQGEVGIEFWRVA